MAGAGSKNQFEVLYKFAGSPDGETPQGLISRNGTLYGATTYGGAYGFGTVFALTPPASAGEKWTETVLYSFGGVTDDGRYPFGSPAPGPGGVLYVTTAFGGHYGLGTVYQLTPPAAPGDPWAATQIFYFYGGSVVSGYYPYQGVVVANTGELYGVASQGGYGYYDYGTVFQLVPPASGSGLWNLGALYSFNGDGRDPAGIILTPQGQIYGATHFGGAYGAGTMFELATPPPSGSPWNQNLIYAFTGGGDGDVPSQPPVLASNGALYGTTGAGGSAGNGTVYKLAPQPDGTWTETVIYSFSASVDGKMPNSPLVIHNGIIYGATISGTTRDNAGGTVFELQLSAAGWTEKILHGFGAAAGPSGSLVVNGGFIYGTTASSPGASGAGMVYRIKL